MTSAGRFEQGKDTVGPHGPWGKSGTRSAADKKRVGQKWSADDYTLYMDWFARPPIPRTAQWFHLFQSISASGWCSARNMDIAQLVV